MPEFHYYGATWYRKTIQIPDEWIGKVVELNLERCHWETTVWVNDKPVGKQNSLATAHRYDLTGYVKLEKMFWQSELTIQLRRSIQV